MDKRVLTIENLIEFCEKQNFTTFNSKESGYQLCVQIPASFEKDEVEDDSLLFGTVKLMHSGRNKNGSNLTEDAAKKCLNTIAYKPILANFTDVNGELDFTSHDFEYNKDGSVTYYEKQVGCFTADKPYLEQDKDHEDRQYIFAKSAIPRQYTAAADIIERKGGTKLSAELGINKMSYDSKEKELLLEDVVVLGATLLGVDPDTGKEIGEGMDGARLDIADFSVENNSIINKSELINEIANAVVNQLSDKLTVSSVAFSEEGGKPKLDKFNELLEKYNKTVEDIDFEYENLTDEELESKFAELFDDDGDESSSEDGDGDNGDDNEANDNHDNVSEDNVSENLDDNENNDVNDDSEDYDTNNGQQSKKSYSVEYSVKYNGETRNFSTSLIEKLNALYELVNSTYGESDNAWYDIDAYDDEKIVLMHDYWGGKHYRQSYQVKKDVYSLKGDRVEVFCTYLTKDEQEQLNSMKSNYAEVSDKLSKYESEPEKMEILNSDAYANIANQKDFEELKKQENHFDFTVEEVQNKADAMLLQYAKSGKLNFAAIEQPKTNEEPKKDFFAFAKVEHNSSFLDGLLKRK